MRIRFNLHQMTPPPMIAVLISRPSRNEGSLSGAHDIGWISLDRSIVQCFPSDLGSSGFWTLIIRTIAGVYCNAKNLTPLMCSLNLASRGILRVEDLSVSVDDVSSFWLARDRGRVKATDNSVINEFLTRAAFLAASNAFSVFWSESFGSPNAWYCTTLQTAHEHMCKMYTTNQRCIYLTSASDS